MSLLKFAMKIVLQAFLWVAILSIPWNNAYIFDHLNQMLFDNPVVAELRKEVPAFWGRIANASEQTYREWKDEGRRQTK